MSTVQINALPAANTIDATADLLPIWHNATSVTQSINRNTYLGITGSPVGNTDSQTLSNKTLGITNTVTLYDSLFTLQDQGDATKQAVFQLSGITTGNTRTLTLPDASLTIVGTATTQTLTNKTLTSPAITGGTIDNSTITVDSISGHTAAGTVTVGGVQNVSGVITTANSIINNGAIATGAVIPNSLVASTGSGWAWQNWTPTPTNWTIGNGTLIAKYVQIGKTVIARINFTMGNTSAIGTGPLFTLPVTSTSSYTSGGDTIGVCNMICAGADSVGYIYWNSTTTAGLYVLNAAGTYLTVTGITASVPGAWTTGNAFYTEFIYEAA